jgi:hypothetical protein
MNSFVNETSQVSEMNIQANKKKSTDLNKSIKQS